ncbi:Atu4866 domain-containing protein [Actinomadura viridis]|uniref:Atu4866 domain-containing protein n=1 Tax=Actinomadura viridis TaxID=58110 RepID=UPI0036C7EDFB
MATRTFLALAAAMPLILSAGCGADPEPGANPERQAPKASTPHPYVGMWVTDDGFIRQELLPNGRYEEERGGRERAYTGSYTVSGNRIDYSDDTGFTADGTFVDADTLHHAGFVMRRES